MYIFKTSELWNKYCAKHNNLCSCAINFRQKGYKYSGTEYAHECFCDNHLDVTRKVADSDCSTKCSGDSQQTCGGTFRIQVFGPHPGASGVGHTGAVQTCEPWCVTADAMSSNVSTIHYINC